MAKILVVDDSPDMLKLIEIRLKKQGHEIVTEMDGLTGLETARRIQPDLIIVDLMLPRMDGYKICGLLKRDARYRKIPVIILTAKYGDENRQMGQEAGADAYVTKPFQPEELAQKIDSLLKLPGQSS